MSLVIAIKEKDRIVLGCDSQVSRYGEGMKDTLSASHSKIFNLNENSEIFCGMVGYIRDMQIIEYTKDVIDELKFTKMELDFKYFVCDFYKKVYDTLLANNRILRDSQNNFDSSMENCMIIAFHDKAFGIGFFGEVYEIEDYLAIGSGQDVAIGVLENNKQKSAEDRIREAIKVCSEKTLYIDNNVVLRYTKLRASNKNKEMNK